MNKPIDLSSMRHRLAPKERRTAMEEWRRNQRMESIETGLLLLAGGALVMAIWVMAVTISRL